MRLTNKVILAALIVILAGSWQLAKADAIDIGNGAGNGNATGSLGLSPNPVGSGSDISVYVHGSGSITNDLLLVVMIPNDSTDLFGATDPLGTITVYSPYSSYPVGSTTGTSSAFTGTGFGLGTGTATYAGNGFWGDVTGGGGTKVSDFLGAGLSSSVNLSNMEGFSSSVGVTSTSYGVYTFLVTTGSVPKNGLVDIQISGGLPIGSSLSVEDDNGDANAWTNAGGVNGGVPEPSSLMLFGIGVLSIVGLALYRKPIGNSSLT